MKYNRIYLIIVGCFLLLASCNSKKHITYYQNVDQSQIANSKTNFQTTIQPDDLLLILVSSIDAEAAVPFNLETTLIPTAVGQGNMAQRQQQLYLVDQNGKIEFPILGELQVGGVEKTQAVQLIKDKLKKYLKDPIVNLRIMNFKVSVQGEVNKPGVITSVSERMTLPEALSLAGDLTIYGKRNNVLVIREVQGKKESSRVDLTKSDFINSPFYYLSQNDLIYVEPNNAKANSSTFNQNIPVWISLSSVIISLILLFKK